MIHSEYRREARPKSIVFKKFPVDFPVSREADSRVYPCVPRGAGISLRLRIPWAPLIKTPSISAVADGPRRGFDVPITVAVAASKAFGAFLRTRLEL
jgi:hypothetical protein